jgi:hypothetical protein
MKMVKSLLLGSAAGLVAVAGAQAADLPVKAKPVQYVKICTLYGVGFYYIPGTDMCIKIGGYVRAEYAWGVNGASVTSQVNNVNNNFTCNLWWRIRGYITADARDQTEYGTVRGYIAVGLSTNTVGFDGSSNQFDANRAFIQWAGFTFGRAQSFFDFFSQAAIGYLGFTPNSDTGDGGKEVLAYTAQFGNGFSATISAESRRMTQIIGQGTNVGSFSNVTNGFFVPSSVLANCGTINPGVGLTAAGATGNCYGGWSVPDVVANLRVDQAWGSAQIAGALHQVNGLYFNSATGTQTAIGPAGAGTLFPNLEPSGAPDSKWGWAVMGGLRLNTPYIGQGDYLQLQGIYTQGALRYVFQNPNGNWWVQDGGSAAVGIMSDGVYGGRLTGLTVGAQNGLVTATNIQLTTAWGINAGYEHFWTPRWRTSLYGGYTSVTYNNTANNILCALQGDASPLIGVNQAGAIGSNAIANFGCDNNWTSWWIGSRTQWNVTKDFYMGLDVAYLKVQGMTTSTGLLTGVGALPGAATSATNQGLAKNTGDENMWMARFRVHRDFYP